MKTCDKDCGEILRIKTVTEYHTGDEFKVYRRPWAREYMKQYRKKHPEYAKGNREYMRAYMKAYRANFKNISTKGE